MRSSFNGIISHSDEDSHRYRSHRSLEFRRHRVHNARIYDHSPAVESSPGPSPRNHVLNDTFTLYGAPRPPRKPKKVKPPTVVRPPRLTPLHHHQFHYHHNQSHFFSQIPAPPRLRTHTDTQVHKSLPKITTTHHASTQAATAAHYPSQSIVYNHPPMRHEDPLQQRASKQPPATGKANSCKNDSHGTQTPRFEACKKRQRDSVNRYVARNRHLHKAQEQQQLQQFVTNSLTQLPRIYLPRLELYYRNLRASDFERLVQTNNGVYGDRSSSRRHRRHREKSRHSDRSSSCGSCSSSDRKTPLYSSSDTDLSSDANEDVDSCIHYQHPHVSPNQRVEVYPVNRQPRRRRHHHHSQERSSNHHTDKIQHVQVLKSPLMWGNESQKKNQKKQDTTDIFGLDLHDVNEEDEDDWNIDLANEPPLDRYHPPGSGYTHGPFTAVNTFEYWRDDGNFDLPPMEDKNDNEKKVHFN